MPHNPSLTDPPLTPPPTTVACGCLPLKHKQRSTGHAIKRRARLTTSICCHSYQDFPQYWLSVKEKKY